MSELDQLRKEFEAADEHMEELRLKAKRYKMPPDPGAWLQKMESILGKKIAELPQGEEITKSFELLIQSNFKHAKRCIAAGDDESLKIAIVVLTENLKDLLSNVRLHRQFEYSNSQSNRASQPRTPQIVEEIIGMLAGRDEKPGKLWNAFIGELNSHRMDPEETLTKKGEPQVHYVDDYTGKEGHMTIGRFRTRIGEARKK